MAAELRQAIAKIGSNTVTCQNCSPHIDGQIIRIGLCDRNEESAPKAKCLVTLSTSLIDIIAAANHCWVCAWLRTLLDSRCSAFIVGIDSANYGKVRLGFSRQVIHTYEKGPTSAYEDQRELLRIAVCLDLRQIGKEFHYFLNFQHSEEHPIDLSDLLDGAQNLDWPSHVPYTTRIRDSAADGRLFRRWKDTCTSLHSNTCEQTGARTIHTIRLIDVRERRIVRLPGNASWTALSYCWGGPQRHSLVKSRLTQYQHLGALTEDILPPVIADAMLVTAILGARYLWVDSMCIVQDDDLDKTTFLTIMAAIYDHAVVTIINAATADANAAIGLSGMREPYHRRTQEPFQVNGIWLAEALDPGHGFYRGYLDECAWSTRGWTFQEGLFSRRCLIFTPEQIFWQCRKSSWCEGSFWERDDELQIYRHYFASNILTSLYKVRDKHWIDVYLAILQKYLFRCFTSETDRLHALTGIHQALEDVTTEKFFWGIPRSKLEHGLAFTPSEPALRRDCHHTFLGTRGQLLSSQFPSWSWLGWLGNIGMGSLNLSITIGTLGLRFYCLDEQGSPKRIDTPPPADETDYDDLQQKIRYPSDAVHPWMDKSCQIITSTDIPATALAQHDLMPSLLCFWTSVAHLKIEIRGWDNYHNEPRVIMSHGDVQFAGLWGRISNLNPPEHGLFIVIGAAKLRMSHGGDLTLRLLLVETDGQDTCPVYRRKHLITEVREREWEKLVNRRWEMVVLA